MSRDFCHDGFGFKFIVYIIIIYDESNVLEVQMAHVATEQP